MMQTPTKATTKTPGPPLRPPVRDIAIERRTQPGLLGARLWFPAPAAGGSVIQCVSTSAEGGRFWRFEIVSRVRRIDFPEPPSADSQGSVRWISRAELADLVRRPLQTSLELRMAWSLALSESVDDR